MYAHTHVPKQINTKELEETAVQLECHCCVILIPAVKLHRFFIYLILSSLPLQTWLLFFCLHKSSCGSKAGWAQITGDVLQIMKSILCLSVFQSPVQFLSVMPVFCLYFSHTHSFNPLSLCDECILCLFSLSQIHQRHWSTFFSHTLCFLFIFIFLFCLSAPEVRDWLAIESTGTFTYTNGQYFLLEKTNKHFYSARISVVKRPGTSVPSRY